MISLSFCYISFLKLFVVTMLEIKERLTLGSWNTGLSPRGKPRASEIDYGIALKIIVEMLQNHGVDILGLGEIAGADLKFLSAHQPLVGYEFFDGTFRQGRAQFDTVAILNPGRVRLIEGKPVFERWKKTPLKLANRLDLVVKDDPIPFHIFISHWPSPSTPNTHSTRVKLGGRLGWILDDLVKNNSFVRVIVMGDFNTEPFEDALEGQLPATRDRKIAMKSVFHLYNPFWRLLGETEPYSFQNSTSGFAGTCFLSKGHLTQWKTVDQMMFGPVFLGKCDWHLNEATVKALPITPKTLTPESSAGIFDHLPVIATLERIGEGGNT